MPEQPIGPILDGLGVTLELADGDLIESALVLTKIVLANGDVTVGLHESEGMDWLGQLALVTAALKIVDDTPWSHPSDDD